MQFDLNHYVAVSYKVHCFICLPKSVSPNQSAVIVLPLLHISESSNIDMNHLYCKRGSHLLRVGLKAWEALSLTFRGNDKITVQYNVTMSIQKKKKDNLICVSVDIISDCCELKMPYLQWGEMSQSRSAKLRVQDELKNSI